MCVCFRAREGGKEELSSKERGVLIFDSLEHTKADIGLTGGEKEGLACPESREARLRVRTKNWRRRRWKEGESSQTGVGVIE